MKILFSLICTIGCYTLTFAQEVGTPWVVPPLLDVDKIQISAKEDDSRFIIEKKDLKGVATKKGELLLPAEYTDIKLFPCGWISASKATTTNQKFLFNAKGENIGLPYERFTVFNNGTAIVRIGDKYGLIDMQGQELIPVRYEKCSDEGKEILCTSVDDELHFVKSPEVKDRMARRVEEAQARSIFPDLILVQKSKNLKGFTNLKGDTIIPPLYRFGAIHPKGYMVASFDGKNWGIIDKQHRTIYPFTAQRFGEWTKSGLIPIRVDNQYGLIRVPSMEIVIPFGTYDVIGTYEPDKELFLVVRNKMNGLIDVRQKELLPLQYGYISQADHITTELSGEGQKRGFYFRPTGFVQEPIYSNVSIHNLMDSLVVATRDTTYALVDSKTGKEVIPFSRFFIVHIGNYFISFGSFEGQSRYSKKKLVGLYNRQGELLVPHDSLMIYVVPEDDSYWVCPYPEDAGLMKEQRSAKGKLIRSLPKEDDLLKYGYVTQVVKYSEGFRTAHRFYYKDANGTEQYYQKIGNPTEGLWPVQKNDLWGFADIHNKLLIDCVFEKVLESVDGYIQVKYKGKWGVLQNPLLDYFKPFEQAVKK
jgi:hypothetical protein